MAFSLLKLIISLIILIARQAYGAAIAECVIESSLGCFVQMQPCRAGCAIDLCGIRSFCAGQTDILPCYECAALSIQCIVRKTIKNELVHSINGCATHKKANESYVLVIKGKNYPVIKNNSLDGTRLISLDLTNNMIEQIEPAAFDSIIGLKYLELTKNRLENISFGQVNKTIEALVLSYNMIRHINLDTFSSLTELLNIDLDSNLIDFIHRHAFDQNKNLKRLYLKSNHLKSVDFRSSSLLSLNLMRNKFATIKTGNSFKGFDSLKVLYLGANRISDIDPRAFDGLANTIRYISLMKNQLSKIDSDVFASVTFKVLSVLNLQANKLDDYFRPEVLKTMVYLTNLYVGFNGISILRQGMFKKLSLLTFLDMSNLNLTEIGEGSQVFAGLIRLEVLSLSNNSIEILGDQLFLELVNLQKLYLESNLIRTLTASTFDGLSKLEILSISANSLVKLTKNVFRSLTSVVDLNLEDNLIEKIDDQAFNGIFRSLQTLNLAGNSIQFLKNYHFNALTELTNLNLASNQISSVESDSFTNLAKLETLILKDNAIFLLDPSLFLNVKSLKTLDLSSNVINDLSKETFRYLDQLQVLNLDDNLMTELDEGQFMYLTYLQILSLARNQINEIDFSCFENLTKLELLNLDQVSSKVSIVPSFLPIFPKLKTLHLKKAPLQLIKQFDLSTLDYLDLDYSEINDLILESIQTHHIKRLHLKNVVFNGSIDESLAKFGLNLTEIDLSGCTMHQTFNIKLLANSKYLTSLSLSNCTGCFNTSVLYNFGNYSKLVNLDLTFNKISGLIDLHFLDMQEQLQTLNLSHNRFNSIHGQAFWSQTNLTTLDLSFNYFQSIGSCVFERLELLEHLDLSYNYLVFLDKEAFCSNSLLSLKYLNLKANTKLMAIGFVSFSPVLNFISIGHASLNDTPIHYMTNCPYVVHLELKDNRFQLIRKSHFDATYLILELDLSLNLIQYIEDDSFSSMKTLLDLTMSYNYLSVLNKRTLFGLTSLRNLNLSHNRIRTVDRSTFAEIRQLRTLDLSSNLIKSIANFTFLRSRFIRTLRLEKNPLQEFFKMEILSGLVNIKFVYLTGSGNQIQFDDEVCSAIKVTLFANLTKTVLGRDFYDGTNVYVYSSVAGKAYLEQDNILKPCLCIVYLLRNNIELNMLYESDVSVYLNQCSRKIRLAYDATLAKGSFQSIVNL